MDLFDFNNENNYTKPLADRMRANTLDEFIGQEHIVGKGCLLRRAISLDRLGSCIFYGPTGTGKTTLAHVIAATTKSDFFSINAVSSGVAEAKELIERAKNNRKMYGKSTYLLLDECHRWNKAQSDCVLEAIEKGDIIFIGSTTENPYASMTRAILSRVRVFEFYKLTTHDVLVGLNRAVEDKQKGLGNLCISFEEGALEHIASYANGDLRQGLNALELAVLTTVPNNDGLIEITKEIATQSIQKRVAAVDDGEYYDMLSAFCKSLRGSDSDAALYWMERMLESGFDPMVIARRLVVHSAEDVGMANPQALVVSVSAMTALQNIGIGEGKIPLAEAIIYVCESSKSNSVVDALGTANELAKNTIDAPVPVYLRSQGYREKPQDDTPYKYPHSYGGWVDQTYLPLCIKDAQIYRPSKNGFEGTLVRAKIIKKNKG